MKHLKQAKFKMLDEDAKFISIDGNKITFTIQDGTVKEAGVNGLQASDLLEYCMELFNSLNSEFSCAENHVTITFIKKALEAQYERTRDRTERGVEGFNLN